LKTQPIHATLTAHSAKLLASAAQETMLGLELRKEFKDGPGKAMVELEQAVATPVAEFLAITYPTTDLLRLLKAAGPDQSRPLVLLGDRGQGKSHLLATLYHALANSVAVQQWLAEWSPRLKSQIGPDRLVL